MSSATNRAVFQSLMILGLVVTLAACSDEAPPDNGDGGSDLVLCSSNEDCVDGLVCNAGLCEKEEHYTCASHADCADGYKCDMLSGKCEPKEPTDGGDEVDGGTDGGHQETDGGEEETDGGEPIEVGGPCSTRYDCPTGLICKNTKCDYPADGNTCAKDVDCPRGEICNFSRQCEPGCLDGRDCDSPELCHPQKFICETCSLTNPCAAGESCLGGECVTAVQCSNAQDCVNGGADGAICNTSGFCANCESHNDCVVDPYKAEKRLCGLDGLCKKVVCSDEECQKTLGSRGYCETAANECATRECLSDADCGQSGTVCNLADYTCIADNPNCDTAACQTECAAQVPPLSCNVAACRCGGGGGSGGEGDPCAVDSDCAANHSCGLGICTEAAVGLMGPCDAFSCMMGACSGAVTGRPCDAMGCVMSLFMGGSIACL